MKMMNNIAQVPQWWKTLRNHLSLSPALSLQVFWMALLLGIALGILRPIYSIGTIGCLAFALILWLRWDELAVTLIVAVHIWVDTYLSLYIIAVLMALVLIFVCYMGRSDDHPWTGPRLIWLWVLFLILTIYPAVNSISFKLSDIESFKFSETGIFYCNVILSSFVMFWLGNIVSKNISAVRRVFQILSILAVLIAIHTIIIATTGNFLFEAPHIETMLAQYSNFQVVGAGTSRIGSFFGGPNGNAVFLTTSFFLPLCLFVECKSYWMKAIYLLAMLLILLAFMSTYSIGMWIALLMGLLIFIFLISRIRYGISLLMTLALLAAIVVTFFPSQIAVQLYRITAQNSLSLHIGAWKTAVEVIKAFPLFGIGIGSQAYLIGSNPYRVFAQSIPLAEPDNAYLQWGAIAGIPVMLIFLLLLICTLLFAWRNWRAMDSSQRPILTGGIAAFITLSVGSLSVDGWTNSAGQAHLGWLIAGIIASPLLGAAYTNSSQRS